MLQVLGRGLVEYNEEKGGLVATCTLTPEELQELAAEIAKSKDEYIACAKFLGKCKGSGIEDSDCAAWFKVPPILAPGDAVETKLDSTGLSESFTLDWNEKEMESVCGGSDTEVRYIPGAAKTGVGVFYPYDPTMSKDRRESTDVTFWLVDWTHHCIYRRTMPMTDSYAARNGILSLIRAVGSIEAAKEWCRAMGVYKKAYNDTHAFNPLAAM